MLNVQSKGKGKAIRVLAWTHTEDSRILSLTDLKIVSKLM